MRKFLDKDLRHASADRLSGRVLAVLVGLSVVLFGAFYLIGFDNLYEEDANFNAPLLTDVVMGYMYLLVVITVGLTVVSAVHSLRQARRADDTSHGVPARRIGYGTAALLVVSMLVTFALASTRPVRVNGVTFADAFWLRVSDMFINTSVILVAVAMVAVAYGLSGINRRNNRRNRHV